MIKYKIIYTMICYKRGYVIVVYNKKLNYTKKRDERNEF